MFSSQNDLVVIAGVLIALVVIFGTAIGTYKLFSSTETTGDILVRFILVVFSALVGVFIVDKTIAFKVSLLGEKLSEELFQLIKTLMLMIFSYYFGTQKSSNK